jgi:hypothetical protein
LTAVGERILKAGHRMADEVPAECFAPLPAADRVASLGLLRRLNGDGTEGDAD